MAPARSRRAPLRASYLEQLYTFELCDASRQIEAAVVAYYALVRTDGTEIAPGRKTMEAAWFPVDELPAELAFDNDEILHYALQRLRNKVEYALGGLPVPAARSSRWRSCAPSTRSSWDAGSTPPTSAGASRRPARIVPTGNSVPGGRHRPPALYRCAGDPASLVKTLRPRRTLRSLPELSGRTSSTS